MKVKIMGVVGTVLEMDAITAFGRNACGEVKTHEVTGYRVKIMESPGKTVEFCWVSPADIEAL